MRRHDDDAALKPRAQLEAGPVALSSEERRDRRAKRMVLEVGSKSRRLSNRGMVIAVTVYLVSGTLQPLVVDSLRYTNSLGPRYLVIPTLANVAGMALSGILLPRTEMANVRRRMADSRLRRIVTGAVALDLLSGILLTLGLEHVGGSLFSVMYASTTAFTAMLARVFLKRRVGAVRSIAVAVVTCGLALDAAGVVEGEGGVSARTTRRLLVGGALVLCGSLLHSAMFVYTEHFVKEQHVMSPIAWGATLGAVESAALGAWCAVCYALFGPFHLGAGAASASALWLDAFALVIINALHAASFFKLIGDLGATSSSLMKGVQTVLVCCVSTVLFCGVDEAQCPTVLKAASVLLVVSGIVVYGMCPATPRTVALLSTSTSAKCVEGPRDSAV